MLLLTDNATSAIRELVDHSEFPEAGGLRIAAESTHEVALSAEPSPDPDDDVLEREGARVFLEPTAAAMLDDRVLDAEVEPDGRVRFLVARQ